jgi:hypothetical protein
MSSKTNKKDCCQRILILKAKAQRLQWENGGLVRPKYSNTSLQSELKVLILIFHLNKKFYQSVSFTSAGYAAIWLILK